MAPLVFLGGLFGGLFGGLLVLGQALDALAGYNRTAQGSLYDTVGGVAGGGVRPSPGVNMVFRLSNEIMQKLSLDASDLGLLGGVFFVAPSRRKPFRVLVAN